MRCFFMMATLPSGLRVFDPQISVIRLRQEIARSLCEIAWHQNVRSTESIHREAVGLSDRFSLNLCGNAVCLEEGTDLFLLEGALNGRNNDVIGVFVTAHRCLLVHL